ncbi:MAG: N-acetylmuramoyl-L-alanine amidase [Lachnospiraceae bacterium]|nr:N-acetylmuramoyl-L-alanine amidase [Lachnospiraceae bacterium]
MRKTIKSLIFIFAFSIMFLFTFVQSVRAYDKVVVVIDPGHGGENLDEGSESGAIYREEILERDVDLITAKAMRDELSAYPNVTVYMTREDNRAISLEDRVSFAKSVDADIMISVHYNASVAHKFYGAEIFTSAFSDCYSVGQGAATCIMNRWKEYGLPDKGIKTRLGSSGHDYYGVIRHGVEMDVPVIIIEHGYLDNDTDFERLGNEDAYNDMGILDARGIADYYGLKKNVMSESIAPTVKIKAPEDKAEPDSTDPKDMNVVIDAYYPSDNTIDFTIHASEEESKLMYYGITYDGQPGQIEDEDFNELILWDQDKESMSGNIGLPEDLSRNLIFRVYNQYCLYTDFEVSKNVIDIAVNKANSAIEAENAENTGNNDPDGEAGEEEISGETEASETKISEGTVTQDRPDEIRVSGSRASQNNSTENENMVLYLLIFVLVIVAILIFFVIIILIRKML